MSINNSSATTERRIQRTIADNRAITDAVLSCRDRYPSRLANPCIDSVLFAHGINGIDARDPIFSQSSRTATVFSRVSNS